MINYRERFAYIIYIYIGNTSNNAYEMYKMVSTEREETAAVNEIRYTDLPL